MIRTTLVRASDVPETWIFEHYCKLGMKLHGQDVKIRSLFKEERTPSMFIYFKEGKYRFKDFATGTHGDASDLVSALHSISLRDAAIKISKDYMARSSNETYEEVELRAESKFKVTSHVKRGWNVLDQKYWTQFAIGSTCLEHYNVFPLESFVMSKDVEGDILDVDFTGQHMYGYFKNNGSLGKIYRPHYKSLKFINVSNFIQGADQLTYNTTNLIICSSLKDGMALHEMGFKDIEIVAPASENSMIPRSNLVAYSLKYKNVYTLFDNDQAGHKAMQKYQDQYGIPGIYLNLSKDIADSVHDHGQVKTKQILTHLMPR